MGYQRWTSVIVFGPAMIALSISFPIVTDAYWGELFTVPALLLCAVLSLLFFYVLINLGPKGSPPKYHRITTWFAASVLSLPPLVISVLGLFNVFERGSSFMAASFLVGIAFGISILRVLGRSVV